MFTHINWLAHLEHHKDLLREAEQERLAQLAVSARPANKAKKKTTHKNVQSKPVEVSCCNPAEIACCTA